MATFPTPQVTALSTKKILTPEELSAGLLAMPSLLETSDDDCEKVILYGGPGSGKTTAAGLMAEFFNILWLDGDKGLRALYHNLPQELLARIKPIRIPDNTMTPIYMHTMLKVITGRQISVCLEHGAANCPICEKNPEAKVGIIAMNKLPRNWIVVMDSYTQFVASAVAHRFHVLNPKSVDTPEDSKFERDDWGWFKNVNDKFGNYVKDLQCNFICISHEALIAQEDDRKKLMPVGGSDPSTRYFAKNFGTEIYCQTANGKHHFTSSTTANAQIQTKSRSNVALEKEACPSLIHVFKPKEAKELLKGSYNEWFFGPRDKLQPKPKEVIAI